MVVRAEPDPRYVFQFGGEPECGPVVYQVPGGAARGGQRQPVFTCRFSAGRRAARSRLVFSLACCLPDTRFCVPLAIFSSICLLVQLSLSSLCQYFVWSSFIV
ncbi:hypothetical protein Zm00014a_024808 [Zea mays]|uniref:Uncharacterized protein n=1 Tax=Zea mays TaxID=4577 RepID=A0A3L6FJ79_MAIZE|nr:hypothetical protein Zm00014a_024808 [Zea mays]